MSDLPSYLFGNGETFGYPEQYTGPRLTDAELEAQRQRDTDQADHRARLGTDYTGRLPERGTHDEEQHHLDRAEDRDQRRIYGET